MNSVWQIFGPVQSILRFDDIEDAVNRANDTTYGLAAAVFTENISTGIHVARLLDAGTVWLVGAYVVEISPCASVLVNGVCRLICRILKSLLSITSFHMFPFRMYSFIELYLLRYVRCI